MHFPRKDARMRAGVRASMHAHSCARALNVRSCVLLRVFYAATRATIGEQRAQRYCSGASRFVVITLPPCGWTDARCTKSARHNARITRTHRCTHADGQVSELRTSSTVCYVM